MTTTEPSGALAQGTPRGARVLASRVFTSADQERFAALSGDRNPLHVDARAARRLLFGEPVVHGVHLLLWALEVALAAGLVPGVSRIQAEFLYPVVLGVPVECRLAASGRLELVSADLVRASVRLESGPAAPIAPAGRLEPVACRAALWDELSGAAGELALGHDEATARGLFPHAALAVPLDELLATTRLVGMRCPGLHSIFVALDLGRVSSEATCLRWSVARADGRFQLLKLQVEGPSWKGTLTALVRPPPAEQLGSVAARGLVGVGEFAAQRALVVGGSRGLGETTAKLLAAGGADVRLTYRGGLEDAARVVSEIREAGGRANAGALDVLDEGGGSLGEVTHLYYFATPFIFERTGAAFDLPLYRRFTRYFVDGFVQTLARARPSAALYPSTTALDEVVAGLAEYTAAKAAGEVLCRHLRAADPGLSLLAPRLPRLRTDQTATVARVSAAEPAEVLLPLLRQLAAWGDT